MMFSELIVSLLINTELNNNFSDIATAAENVIFSLSSKLLYFSMIVIFKHVSGNGEHRYKAKEMISLIVLPISTCLFLSLFNQIRGSLAARVEILFVIFSIMLIISNFIVYIVCERIIENNIQIQDLKQVEYKRAIDEKSYRLIKEKYDELRILVHDFDKYCNHIEAMTAGGGRDVRAVTRQIKNKNKEFLTVEYTNNKALNILLSQKMKECNSVGIDFQIYAQNIDLSFINESDTVAIFANLMDNAIESCMLSEQKKIFLQIYTMNDSFIVICIDNSADTEPNVADGKLRSRKTNNGDHGIGMMSIKRSLENYGGRLKWDYERDSKIFNTTILIARKKPKNDRCCNIQTDAAAYVD